MSEDKSEEADTTLFCKMFSFETTPKTFLIGILVSVATGVYLGSSLDTGSPITGSGSDSGSIIVKFCVLILAVLLYLIYKSSENARIQEEDMERRRLQDEAAALRRIQVDRQIAELSRGMGSTSNGTRSSIMFADASQFASLAQEFQSLKQVVQDQKQAIQLLIRKVGKQEERLNLNEEAIHKSLLEKKQKQKQEQEQRSRSKEQVETEAVVRSRSKEQVETEAVVVVESANVVGGERKVQLSLEIDVEEENKDEGEGHGGELDDYIKVNTNASVHTSDADGDTGGEYDDDNEWGVHVDVHTLADGTKYYLATNGSLYDIETHDIVGLWKSIDNSLIDMNRVKEDTTLMLIDSENDEYTYTGQVVDGLPQGYGIKTYTDINHTYIGQWCDGVEHGKGECRYADGQVYVGEWESGIIQGRGIWTKANGTVEHDGMWYNGDPV